MVIFFFQNSMNHQYQVSFSTFWANKSSTYSHYKTFLLWVKNTEGEISLELSKLNGAYFAGRLELLDTSLDSEDDKKEEEHLIDDKDQDKVEEELLNPKDQAQDKEDELFKDDNKDAPKLSRHVKTNNSIRQLDWYCNT